MQAETTCPPASYGLCFYPLAAVKALPAGNSLSKASAPVKSRGRSLLSHPMWSSLVHPPLLAGHQIVPTRRRSEQRFRCLTSGSNGSRGFCLARRWTGHPPSAGRSRDVDDGAPHLALSHRLTPPSLEKKGLAAPGQSLNNWAISILLMLSSASLSAE